MPVSVIIPALNEVTCLGDTIAALRKQRPHEIIVVDGGSTDATREIAESADLVLQAPRGRASQMNAGAARASGDVLLFLHADCALEAGALVQAEELLRRRGVAAGCFTMRVAASGPLYRWIDLVATARVRLAGMIYGDQGLFLFRQRFERVGCFPAVGIMEDVFLSCRLRRLGKMVVAPAQITVSPRRWQRVGVLRQTVRNWTLLALAAAGVNPDALAPHHPPVRCEQHC
jgi:rSAM/selenodomain-associated transferase 2